jgi:hypothetical protein
VLGAQIHPPQNIHSDFRDADETVASTDEGVATTTTTTTISGSNSAAGGGTGGAGGAGGGGGGGGGAGDLQRAGLALMWDQLTPLEVYGAVIDSWAAGSGTSNSGKASDNVQITGESIKTPYCCAYGRIAAFGKCLASSAKPRLVQECVGMLDTQRMLGRVLCAQFEFEVRYRRPTVSTIKDTKWQRVRFTAPAHAVWSKRSQYSAVIPSLEPIATYEVPILQKHILQKHILQKHILQQHILQQHILQKHILQKHILQKHILQKHILQQPAYVIVIRYCHVALSRHSTTLHPACTTFITHSPLATLTTLTTLITLITLITLAILATLITLITLITLTTLATRYSPGDYAQSCCPLGVPRLQTCLQRQRRFQCRSAGIRRDV